MALRKGKTKKMLESSIASALLAVEIYNKPRVTYKVESYISLMINAWTKLFLAYFNNTIGDKYYYKKGGRYQRLDGQKRTWSLNECIKKYGELNAGVESNLKFFINLRNQVEHNILDDDFVEILIFGESQALLYNYESMIVTLFGDEYAMNENLAFSLQFSKTKTTEQLKSIKELFSNEVKKIHEFINKFRNELTDEIFDSQEYSIKLLQIPKISNTNRSNLSVEFVNWSHLNKEDKVSYEKVTTLIKEKIIKVEVINPNRYKPNKVVELVNSEIEDKFTIHLHSSLWSIFSIRPGGFETDKYHTNSKYCNYDEANNTYLYQDSWVNLVIGLFNKHNFTSDKINELASNRTKLNICDFD